MNSVNSIEPFCQRACRLACVLAELAYIDIQRICWELDDKYCMFELLRHQYCCNSVIVDFRKSLSAKSDIPESISHQWQVLDARISAYLPDLAVDEIWEDEEWIEIASLARKSLKEWSLLDEKIFPAQLLPFARFNELALPEKHKIVMSIFMSVCEPCC